MNKKILFVLTSLVALSTYAHPSVELKDIKAVWAGDEGREAKTPDITVTVRNKTKNKCIKFIDALIVLKGASKTVTKKVNLSSEEIEEEYINLGTSEIKRRSVFLVPFQKLEFHYTSDTIFPSWSEGKATVVIKKVTELPAEQCGYFPNLTEDQREHIESCYSAFDSYIPEQSRQLLDAYMREQGAIKGVEIVSRSCKKNLEENKWERFDTAEVALTVHKTIVEICRNGGCPPPPASS